MRSLIIIPRYGYSHEYSTDKSNLPYTPAFIPIGLAYISSTLKKNGYQTDVLNLNLSEGSVDTVIQKAFSQKTYDFMLTGGLSPHYTPVRDCVNMTRRYSPHIKIVLGGGLVSSQPELVFRVLQPDYLVIGEGEDTIAELMRCIEDGDDLSRVDGLGYRSAEGNLVLTKPKKPIQDLDSIPWPDLDGIGLNYILEQTFPSQTYLYDLFDYPRPYPISASRSCPYLCTFCFHPLGNKYRQRTISNTMEELSFGLKQYKFNIIVIYDELFSYDKQRVKEFCRKIKKLSDTVPWEIKWTCQMRVDTADEELIEEMQEAGCYCLSLGLESYSHTVLKSMKKHITPQQIDKTLRLARRFKISIQGNFIFGDKAETTETVKETLNYWRDNHSIFGDAIALGFIEPYPGTELYKHCLTKNLISDELDFLEHHILDPINMSDTMTEEEFQQLKVDILTAHLLYDKCVSPSKINRIDGLYEIHVKCPYCKITSVYRNYFPPIRVFDRRAIICRNCMMRFLIVTRYYKSTHLLGRIAYRIIGYKRLAYLIKILRVLESFFSYAHQWRPKKLAGR